jgi:membrane-associated phospholipid phosphatase
MKKIFLIVFFVITFLISFAENNLKKDLFKNGLAGVSLATGSYFFDEQIRNMTSDLGFEFGEIIDTKVMIGTSAALYVSSYFINDEDFSKTSFQSLSSSFITGGTILALKLLVGRARPYMNQGKDSFELFRGIDSDNYRSFPSAHSGLSWAITTPYAERYSKWLYAIPTIISGFRVIEDKHWTSDVVFGSLIGYLTGKIAYEKEFYISF